MRYILLLTFIAILACTEQTSEKEEAFESKYEAKADTKTVATYQVSVFHPETKESIDTTLTAKELQSSLPVLNEFRYPLMKVDSSSDSFVRFSQGDILVELTAIPFDSSEYELELNEYNLINSVSGKSYFGTDGYLPSTLLKSLYVKRGKYSVTYETDENTMFFEPSLCPSNNPECHTESYIKEDGEVIIKMLNGDGAGSYTLIFFIDTENDMDYVVGADF